METVGLIMTSYSGLAGGSLARLENCCNLLKLPVCLMKNGLRPDGEKE
jgi:hypothetical protein